MKRPAVSQKRNPETSMVTGRVSTQAIRIFRIVLGWSPDLLAAIVPAIPDERIWVVETGAASTAVPNVELFMSADTGNKFWLGKVNLTMAMAKGTVRAKGPVPKLIKLIPQAKNLFPEYRLMLQSQDRQDLIDA